MSIFETKKDRNDSIKASIKGFFGEQWGKTLINLLDPCCDLVEYQNSDFPVTLDLPLPKVDTDIISHITATQVLNLPTAIGNKGVKYNIGVDDPADSFVITITPFGSETVANAATLAADNTTPYSLISDGANWIAI